MRTLPSTPGLFYWTEWKSNVDVTRRGRHLYVTPPGGIEVRVTHRIAGSFQPPKKVRKK